MLSRGIGAALFAFLVAAGDLGAQQLVDAFPNLLFTKPLFLTHCGDGTNRVFVVEQTGVVRVFPNDSTVAVSAVFLDLAGRISSSNGEEGLLGLAFHPSYAQNGYFYVNYTAPAPLRTVIARYTVRTDDPDRAEPSSEFRILEILQPYSNHNGGMLAFGPDGYLYIGMGDGGSGGDPQNNAQNLTTLLGKMLRIDVNDTTATAHYVIPADNPYADAGGLVRGEIWASGLRNPWRFSFDTVTGLLWAGDVGQNAVEEIDIIARGKNYGWRIMEGTSCYNPPSGCDRTGLELPVKAYSHALGEAVVGGYVYRGARRPDLAGAYLYGDYISGRIWMLGYAGGVVTADSLVAQVLHLITSFGIDEQRELYVVTDAASGSGIYRFSGDPRPDPPPAFSLSPNYPNPFAATTKIAFVLGRPVAVSLKIYDISGRLVRTLFAADSAEGTYEEPWDGTDSFGAAVASGIYLCRIEAGPFTQARKIVLLK